LQAVTEAEEGTATKDEDEPIYQAKVREVAEAVKKKRDAAAKIRTKLQAALNKLEK